MKLIRRSSSRFVARNGFSLSTPMAPELRALRRPGFTLNTREDRQGKPQG